MRLPGANVVSDPGPDAGITGKVEGKHGVSPG